MAIPAAAFTTSPSVVTPNTVITFIDGSTHTPTGWSWDFGDGHLVTGVTATTHTFVDPGRFPVTLIAGNDSGTGANTVTVNVVNYAGASDQTLVSYVKSTLPFTVELPIGTSVKEFAPNQLYLLSALATDSATTADVNKHVSSGRLVIVKDKSTNVSTSTAPAALPLSIPGYRVFGATAGTATKTTYSFKMASGATGINPTGTTAAVVAYAVDKALPNALVLNPTTGAISGTPTGTTGTSGATYTVYSVNAGGYAATPLFITVTY